MAWTEGYFGRETRLLIWRWKAALVHWMLSQIGNALKDGVMILAARDPHVDTDQRSNQRRKQLRQLLHPAQVQERIEDLKQRDQIRLSDLVSDAEVHQMYVDLGYSFRESVYTPAIALMLFIRQVLSRDSACSTVVAKYNADRKKDNLPPVSADASGYCKARNRLPIELVHAINDKLIEKIENNIPKPWKWHDRDVLLVDGFVLHGPDTEANQKKYPQPTSQQEGLGFPQVRVVALTSLATGVIAGYKIGPTAGKQSGEKSLFREFAGTLKAGSILVGDANFETFPDVAWPLAEGIDVVFCINGSRNPPFQGSCEQIEESLEVIKKPQFKSARYQREEWEQLPDTLTYRMIRYRVSGGRCEEFTIVTTLLDREAYSATAIAQLYGFRWDVESDINAYKTTLDMNNLRCQSPENMEREIAVGVLGYNLVHALMCDSASVLEVHPRQISFSLSRDALIEFIDELETTHDLMWLVWTSTGRLVRNRPCRQEPRKIKNRHSKYARMKEPRPSRLRRMAATAPEP